jgi:hypothetical protein
MELEACIQPTSAGRIKHIRNEAMKLPSLAILCCLLSGCAFEPTFDTSSWNAWQQSSSAIKARLNNDELRRLEASLKYLLFEGAPVGDGPVVTNVIDRIGVANPGAVLSRLGPRIDGKTAAAVVQNLSLRLDKEIAQAEAMLGRDGSALGNIEIGSPRYYWRTSGFLAQPVIEFSIFNAGKTAISRVYLHAVLTTPNRSLPWVRQGLLRNFKGGLEPREKQEIIYEPRGGEWNDKQLKDLYQAELKVTVANFEYTNGQRMIAIDSDLLDYKRRVRAALG